MFKIIKLSLPMAIIKKSSRKTSFDHFNIFFFFLTPPLLRFCGFLITIKNILTIKVFDNKLCALNLVLFALSSFTEYITNHIILRIYFFLLNFFRFLKSFLVVRNGFEIDDDCEILITEKNERAKREI